LTSAAVTLAVNVYYRAKTKVLWHWKFLIDENASLQLSFSYYACLRSRLVGTCYHKVNKIFQSKVTHFLRRNIERHSSQINFCVAFDTWQYKEYT
jgi:hypothetical protein